MSGQIRGKLPMGENVGRNVGTRGVECPDPDAVVVICFTQYTQTGCTMVMKTSLSADYVYT